MPDKTRRDPPPAQAGKGDRPAEACDRAILSVTAKADANERLARRATGTVIGASAAIPVCVIAGTAGHPFVWGQLLPALFAAVSALAAGVLQFERPHERWRMYRGYQRQLEDLRFRFENRLQPFGTDDDKKREQLFGLAVSDTVRELHQNWSGLVPVGAQVSGDAPPSRTADAKDQPAGLGDPSPNA